MVFHEAVLYVLLSTNECCGEMVHVVLDKKRGGEEMREEQRGEIPLLLSCCVTLLLAPL